MKRVLSLVLALVLVLGMIPMGFAADQTAGEILKGMNLLAGDENGNLNEDQNLNRAEMMVIMARMMGKFEEAKSFALPSTFTDLAGFSWAVPYIAYAEMNEWTAGVGAGMFNPAGAVTAQEVAVFMLKALGYEADVDFTWANAVEVATAKGLMAGVSTPATSSILRGDLFKVMYTTLNTNVKGEAVALGVKLGYMKPAVLAVSSVKALNSKEIEITFNKAMNEGSAEDETNYVVKVGGVSEDFNASLEEDNVVVLTLDESIEAITSVNVEVSEDVLDDALKALGADYKTAFIFYDEDAPEVVSTEVDGNTLTVLFNEYVGSIGLIKIDGEVMLPENGYPEKEFEFDIAGLDLEDGKYTASFANVADLQQDDANVAGYIVTSFIVSDTSTAPKVAEVDQTDDYTLEIEFTKKLAFEPTVTAKNGGVDIVADVQLDPEDDTIAIVTLDKDLADEMYDDGDDVFNVALTVSSYQALSNDMYGDKYTTTFKLELDSTAPVLVAGYNKADGYNFELRFNEVINAVGEPSDIIVVDEDGVRLAVDSIYEGLDTDSDPELTVLVIEMVDTIDAGTYTITVAADTVEDESENGNKAFTTTVKESADADEINYVVADGNDDEILISFYEEYDAEEEDLVGVEMGSSALVAANYKIDGAALPAGTSLYFTSTAKDQVLIELPSSSVTDGNEVVLSISNKVLGADGEEIDSIQLYQIVDGLKDNVKPVLESAEKTNSNTITLTFSEDVMGSVAVDPDTLKVDFATDFKVTVNGVEIAISEVYVKGDLYDEVVFTTKFAYNTNQPVVVEVVDNDFVTDEFDNAITTGTKVTATK